MCLLDALEHILAQVMESAVVGEVMEKFRLEFSLKCLQMENFEKRLFGISEIKDLIDYTFNRDVKVPANSKVLFFQEFSFSFFFIGQSSSQNSMANG